MNKSTGAKPGSTAEATIAKWDRVTLLKRQMRPLVRKLMSGEANAEDGHEFNRKRAELLALDRASITLGTYPWDDPTERIV